MSKLKKAVSAALRWSWFALLVILAFGYLAAGLSQPPQSGLEKATVDREQVGPAEMDQSVAEAIGRVNQAWAESLLANDLQSARQLTG